MQLRRGETVPPQLPAQTPILPVWASDHLCPLRNTLGLPPQNIHAEAGRVTAGALIITGTSTAFG